MKTEIKLTVENDDQLFYQIRSLSRICKDHFFRTTGLKVSLYRIVVEEIHYVREFETNYIYVTYFSEERELTQNQETRRMHKNERQDQPL